MSQGGCLYWIKITFGQDLVTLREYKIWLFWCFCRRRDDREFICKSVLFLLFREYTRTVFWLKKRNTRQINSWKSNKNVPENDGNERAMMSAAKPVYWIAVTLYDYVIFVLCKYRDRSLHSTECGSPLLATTARKVKQESPQPARLLLSIAAGQWQWQQQQQPLNGKGGTRSAGKTSRFHYKGARPDCNGSLAHLGCSRCTLLAFCSRCFALSILSIQALHWRVIILLCSTAVPPGDNGREKSGTGRTIST